MVIADIGTRVWILVFFAATVNNKSSFFIFLLAHCLFMALTLRPEKDDSDLTQKIAVWRKFFLAFSLVLAQLFAFLPFKQKTSTRLQYASYYYLVNIARPFIQTAY